MSDLASLLAGLYPDQPDHVVARSFLRDAGLDPDRVNLDGDAVVRWERILEEAWNQGRLATVVAAAARQYESRTAALAEGERRYRETRAVSRGAPGTAEASAREVAITQPGLLRLMLDRWLPRLHAFLTRIGWLADPPERAEIVRFLGELQASLRNDMQEKTYLPLAGRPVPASPMDREAGRDPFLSPIHQVILQLAGQASGGGDSTSAQIAVLSRRSRVVRNILRALSRTDEPLVLIGEPGSGKTMTLHQAAMLLARDESRRVFPHAVLLVRLGEFHVAGPVDRGSILTYLKQSSPPSIQRWIDALERVGRLVIFFDGMDEMSRERYGEHTEALSRFAGGSPSETLFTCRITDFSPRFVHRRLVLLPFDRQQVANYLARYIESFPLIIDRRPWKLKELSRRIVSGELPIQANNPFVLWLLCLYLQEKRSWPTSRVELLGFYNERNYLRKEEERSAAEPTFPDMRSAFAEWARVAYLISEQNRGSAISVSQIERDADSGLAREMIRIGKRCGILGESKGLSKGEDHLVRFEHHRFQEYFTAYHIHNTRPPIQWLDKLDAPRWQETMLNLIFLGDSEGVVETLVYSLAELAAAWDDVPPGEEDEHEMVLSDRVELASRILRQSSGAPRVRETLLRVFCDTVELLGEKGNPITQVKMMRASQNVPEVNFIKMLSKPLHSPINWVREQALILIAARKAGAPTAASDIATQMGYDLANGLFLIRLPAYARAVGAARDRRSWGAFFAGILCSALNLLVLLGAAAAIYYAAWSLHSPRASSSLLLQGIRAVVLSHAATNSPLQRELVGLAVLGRPAAMVLFAALLVVASAATLWKAPQALWIVLLFLPASAGNLILVSLAMWQGSEDIYALCVLLFGASMVIGIPLATLAGAVLHVGSLTLYLGATRLLGRGDRGPAAFYASAWRSCHFDAFFILSLYALGVAALLGGAALLLVFLVHLVAPLLIYTVKVISVWSHLPFNPWVNSGIVLLTFMLATSAVWSVWRRRWMGLLSSRLIGVLVAAVMFFFLQLLNLVVGKALVRVLAAVICLVVAIWGFRLFRDLLRGLANLWLSRFQRLGFGSFTAEEWKARLSLVDSGSQASLLARTDHQALSLTPMEFLQLLREVHPTIKGGPATSAYWEKRDQLEEVLRLERQG